jgi:hypothetical protein
MKVHPTPVFSMNDEMAIDMLKVTEGEFTNPGGESSSTGFVELITQIH